MLQSVFFFVSPSPEELVSLLVPPTEKRTLSVCISPWIIISLILILIAISLPFIVDFIIEKYYN